MNVLTVILALAGVSLAVWIGWNWYGFRQLRRYRPSILQSLGRRDKTDLELAQELDLGLRNVRHVLRLMQRRKLIRSYLGGSMLATYSSPRLRLYTLSRPRSRLSDLKITTRV